MMEEFAPGVKAAGAGPSTGVLLIEDNPGDARLIREMMNESLEIRYAFAHATRLDEGLAYLQAPPMPVDVVLLDLSLPDSQGLDTVEPLLSRAPHLPIIVLTGHDDEELGLRIVRKGAQDYLVKGRIDGYLLQRTIRYAIERKQMEHELEKKVSMLSVLASGAQRISESLVPGELATAMARTCVEDFGLRVAWVVRRGADERVRTLALYPEDVPPPAEFTAPSALGDDRCCPLAQTLLQRHRIIVDPFERAAAEGHCGFCPQPPTTRSLACFPLVSQERVLGGLVLYSDREGFFTDDMAEFFQSYAHLASGSLENAWLFSATEKHLQQLTALRDIDKIITGSFDLPVNLEVILDTALTLLHLDAAAVLVLNPHTQMLEYAVGRGFRTRALRQTSLRLGEGNAGRAALDRRRIVLRDLPENPASLSASPHLADEGFRSYIGIPLVAKGRVRGVLEVFRRTDLEDDSGWHDLLDSLASQAAIAIDNATLYTDLERANTELSLAYESTLEGWARCLDYRDRETEGHSRRVTEMTVRVARVCGIPESRLPHLRRGALLHDIGKLGVPDHILLKPGKLDAEEWAIMRRHPELAYQLLAPISYLCPALDIPYCHHEKWDGSGYPRGLKGEEIPLEARIFAVVDVWDALCSDRPYRPAWPEEKALAYLIEEAGSHFDPRVVEVFLKTVHSGR